MNSVSIVSIAGTFAENKDKARDIRLQDIEPALQRGEDIILDFDGVEAATQSFIHALISELIRRYGSQALEKVVFRNCNETVKKIIQIVADYMQEAES